MKMQIKTIDEIVDAILAHGVNAYQACKFPAILEQEVKAGGHEGEEFEKTKAKVAERAARARRLRRAS